MNPYIFPVSFAQQRLWFLDQFDPGKSVYHLLYAVRFDASLNFTALHQALNELVRRQESLRTSFVAVNGEPMQAIARELHLELPVIDLLALSSDEADIEAKRWRQIEGELPFDLAVGPLLRTHLLRLRPDENLLVIAMHHIISDGWSMGIFLRELATLYEAFRNGQPSPLPELSLQYADYSVWQREWMQGEVLDGQLSYWTQHLAGAPAALELATDRPRPAMQTFAGARQFTEIPLPLADKLRAFSRSEKVTIFMTLLAAYDVLLWRYSGQDDVVVGIPLASRSKSELEDLIGLFANTLPIRTSLSGNPTFRELLHRVRDGALGAYVNQEIPFDKLVEAMQPERSLSHSPLFQVIFALENTPPALDHNRLALEWLEVDRGTARCDLSLFLTDKGGALSAMWEYSTDVFTEETIREMIASYTNLLTNILESPAARIGELEIWSDDQRQHLLTKWNPNPSPQASTQCIHHQFEAAAELRPDAIAVSCGEDKLSFKELNQRANRVGHLLQRLGVRPEVPVGIYLDRSTEMIVALLGVLKAGGAYVPVDPAYPAERASFMLEDANVRALLTSSELVSSLPSLTMKTILLDEVIDSEVTDLSNPVSNVTLENLAYAIYTSGSTGKPKGVEVTHQTVAHLFAATCDKIGFGPGDVWTVVHSYAFDFSVWEIWGCLSQGGTLVVVPVETAQSPSDLFDLICREQVTVLNQTPAALRELLVARAVKLSEQPDWQVRSIVCGGDALDQELALELAKLEVPVWNFYGPTESTVWTTFTRIVADESASEFGTPSIGPPIADLQVFLLDEFLRPVPANVPGELFIGGAGLARGYLKRPELTAEKFVPHPFSNPGARLYRTGDLARHRHDGRIEFIGRIDNQIKLRGFRIELGEIESALADHPGINQAVVIIRNDSGNDERLVAYVVPENGQAPDANELRTHLRLTLPEYMVPAAFVVLDEIPLTSNKKVDRRALPAPERSAESASFIAPRSPIEELLVEMWSQLLHVTTIGVTDNFFELGGHSLLATQLISRVRQAFNVDLSVRTVFECPTIAEMALRVSSEISSDLQGAGGLEMPPIVKVPKDGKLPLSFAQQRLWFLDQLEPGNPFYNIGRALRLKGKLDRVALFDSLNQILSRHESLRTVFGADEGTPFQRIVGFDQFEVAEVDLRSLPDDKKEDTAAQEAAVEVNQPFDLTTGPLLRARLIRLADDDHVLVLTMHHIAADEWSLAILFRELTALYELRASGKDGTLAELPIQCADYAVWQRQWLQGEAEEKLVSYWRKQLQGAPTILNLPTDKPQTATPGFRGAYELLGTSPAVRDGIRRLSRKYGATLFMTCLAAFQILLSRFTGQQDLLIGTDVANRNRVETEGLIGFFTNLLPLRGQLNNDLTFDGLLAQVREVSLEAYAHQDLPFAKLVEEIRPERAMGRNPLVQVLLVMQNPAAAAELKDLEVSRYDLPLETSRFDLVLFLAEREEGLTGFWLYNADLFEATTIAGLSRNYEQLLAQIIEKPNARIDSFEILTKDTTTQPRAMPQAKPQARPMEKKDLQKTKTDRLKSIRRKSVDFTEASIVKTGPLKGEETLPLLVEPRNQDVDLAEWVEGNRTFIEEKLLQHGALLFRGFDLPNVPEFEKFASAICPELFGEYGDLPREELGGKVYGSTPYPSDERILFHNESSHMHQWPMLIWFYCMQPSLSGGESPVIDCRRIYQSLNPIIRTKFENEGLMYVRNFTDGLDVSWQDFFHTNDRNAVESYCRKASIDFEWKGDNGLRTRQVGPAVVRHPQTGEVVFFNQLQLHHISCLAAGVRESLLSMMREEDLPRNVYYGDGSAIEDSVMEHIGELYEKLGVSFPWEKHDVLMLNNMLVAHSRNPYVGERKIVVALGNLVNKIVARASRP